MCHLHAEREGLLREGGNLRSGHHLLGPLVLLPIAIVRSQIPAEAGMQNCQLFSSSIQLLCWSGIGWTARGQGARRRVC